MRRSLRSAIDTATSQVNETFDERSAELTQRLALLAGPEARLQCRGTAGATLFILELPLP